MWPSMVTHTRNLCSAFNPSKVHTHSSEHTHTPWTHTRSSGQPFMLRRPGSSWGFGALFKGTSVVVLRVKTFYSGTIESVLTQCISVWYGNSSSQDCKALQRVVRLAERISGSALPSLQDIYLKRCKSRAVKITKDSNHPGNCLFTLLPSGKRFCSLMAKTERLRRSFFPHAIRLLNSTQPLNIIWLTL